MNDESTKTTDQLIAERDAALAESAELRLRLDRAMRATRGGVVYHQVNDRDGRMVSLGRMATGVAHEINSPLGAMRIQASGALRKLERGETDAAIEKIKKIEGLIERVALITNQLRTYGSEAQSRVVRKASISDIVSNVLKLHSDALGLEAHSVEVLIPSASPEVRVSVQEIEQVLLSLLINAVEAMGDEKGVIRIASRQNPEYVQLSVSDSGCGVSDDVREMIFEPFFSSVNGRSGLGLSVALSLIKANEGELFLENTSGHGSTFTFSLPRASGK